LVYVDSNTRKWKSSENAEGLHGMIHHMNNVDNRGFNMSSGTVL